MAKRKSKEPPSPGVFVRLRRWAGRFVLGLGIVLIGVMGLYAVAPVPTTPYQIGERMRLGGVSFDWVPMDQIAPVMARSAVAAEDANFCAHWGFDIAALREAIEGGMRRGGSTIDQQTVKNVFLWQGRSWPRKAMETLLTPLSEIVWTKRRILTLYLNVIEFGEGVFGVEAAAQHHFGVSASELSPRQAALLAAILPAPKDRSAARPSRFVTQRAAAIRDGAETIRRDGRDDCFEPRRE
ncbi:MAG: monofunctional biosynthetic peptidoglycan transglycosylase [Pseudomonadota bacterium]